LVVRQKHWQSQWHPAPPAQDAAAARVVPNHVLAQQGAAGGAPAGPVAVAQAVDYGPELVDLIQRTISPANWDINGGNGAIVYFAPLRVLDVRAPSSVQGQIGGVLGPLRVGP
jgi:hypothetical protein